MRTRERVDIDVPADLREARRGRDWPDGLLERALASGISPGEIRGWLQWRKLDAADLTERIAWHEKLTLGGLRAREATLADNDAYCDLCANAPEEIGELEVTSLRGPDGFAQFRLQENVNLHVIADGNVLAAACGWSRRKVQIAGRRFTVSYGQALRVHRSYRRQGFADAVRSFSSAANAWRPALAQYDYMRAGNFAVVGWWQKHVPDFFKDVPQEEGQVPGLPVRVAQIPARPAAAARAEIRPARPDDLVRCAALVNRTHGAQDLFRPYTEEFLADRLDEGYWGPRTTWLPSVYGWTDYFVLESGGRIVACGGVWDRGRDLRERFRTPKTGEERILSHAALMDWGFEAGAEHAMAELIDDFAARTHAFGRDFLLAPLDGTPELAERIAPREPVQETRYLRWGLKEPAITRPYTDLAYW